MPLVSGIIDYHELYIEQHKKADDYWKDKIRPSYEADLWYNRNRNEISLYMMGDLCEAKDVLDIGARLWIEDEFLKALKVGKVTKVDIVGDPTYDVIEADAHHLPFEAHSFDVVICREVIEHVHNSSQVYAEITRVTRDGGYLHITTPNCYSCLPDGKVHLATFTPEGFIKDVKAAGFKILMKRGNAPNIFNALLPLSQMGFKNVLVDFKRIAKQIKNSELSYYTSSQMFILAQKVNNAN